MPLHLLQSKTIERVSLLQLSGSTQRKTPPQEKNLMYRLAGRHTPHMSVHIFSARNTMVLKVSFKSRGVDYKTSRKRKLSGKGAV